MVKSDRTAGSELYLYFYRYREAYEIGVMIEVDWQLSPLEIKTPAVPDFRLMRAFPVWGQSLCGSTLRLFYALGAA